MTKTYSIAIRTLGTAGNAFRRELMSIANQTLQPEKVLVYVADSTGLRFVDKSIGKEEFRYVKKGMVAQRALSYDEIDSDYILLLDDDVELAPDTAERLLNAIVEKDADCVGADVFKNYAMSIWSKIFAILTNFVFPHLDKEWGLKIHRNGSFSYQTPKYVRGKEKVLTKTQKVDGPCAMWKKSSINSVRWQDELWMDMLSEFAYGDDTVESYKSFVNGGSLWLMYNSGVEYLNAKTASKSYHHSNKKYYVRSLMSFCIWWRTIYEVLIHTTGNSFTAIFAFCVKWIWLLLVNIIAGFLLLDLRIPYYYIKGTIDAWKFVHSKEYSLIPKYCMRKV